MKLNNTYILFDSGETAKKEDWELAHGAITSAIQAMTWPDSESSKGFKIPRIVKLKKGATYTERNGKQCVVRKKDGKTLRNGVTPIRMQFRRRLQANGWTPEHPLSLAEFFKTLRGDGALPHFQKYPFSEEAAVETALNESVGDFDFWFRTNSGFRTVVEWETGNISSSHRSLNKMCLALLGGLADAAVLAVPSLQLYPHLTDRIGNIRELQPYFYFWNRVGTLVKSGLLAVMEVEHDSLFKSHDLRDYIPSGRDGNSKSK